MAGTFIYLPPSGDQSNYWGDAVATAASLPATGEVTGEAVLVLDTLTIYAWDGAIWQPIVNGPADVSGPASAVDSQMALFNGITGKVIKAATGTGYAKGSTGIVSFQSVPIPVADGGTNSTTALNNNRILRSAAGAIGEAGAITAARALISDANGIPTHSAVTATELGYVAGVTSAIQTQINSAQADADQAIIDAAAAQATANGAIQGPASATDEGLVRYNGTTGKSAQNSAVTLDDAGGMTFTGTTGFLRLPVLTTAQKNALTPLAGMLVFDSDLNRPYIYLAAPVAAWTAFCGWGD